MTSVGQNALHRSTAESGNASGTQALSLVDVAYNDSSGINEYAKGKPGLMMTWECQILLVHMFRGFSFLLPLLI